MEAKQRIMKKQRWFCALLFVLIFIVGRVAYRVGYGRGTEDQKLRVIPFNLYTHFQMYKLCDYIDSPEKYASLARDNYISTSATIRN